jgi:hypothetical protein
MISEPDNLAAAGTDNAQISDDDDYSGLIDDFDPTEDNEAAEELPETASEEVETETAEASAEDGQSEEAEKATDEPAPAVKDDVKITLADGRELPLAELKQGYLRQSDYTRKAQEVANERNALAAQAERITETVHAFAKIVEQSVPPPPPIELARSDPGRYVYEKSVHEAAMLQVQQLLELRGGPQDVKANIDQAEQAKVLARENEALARAFPETAKPETREAFFRSAFDTAKQIGFTDQEFANVTDHRLYALAHWARKGMEAEKAKEIAKTKVADVPPIAQPKRPVVTTDAQRNKTAMRRLAQTGRLQDALAIDFD